MFNLIKVQAMKAKVSFDGVEYVAERNGIKGYGDTPQEAMSRLDRKEAREKLREEFNKVFNIK